MLELSSEELSRLAGYSRLPPRLERAFPEAATLQTCDKYGAAAQLDAITSVLGGSRLDTVIGLGHNAGYFCLSLLDAGVTDRATVYDADPGTLSAGRIMALHMDLGDRIEFIERAAGLNFLRALPSVDMIVCLNLLHHAGIAFDQAAAGRDGWESYANAWLSEMRRKCMIAVVGIEFEEKKPENWDAPHPYRPARFAQCVERAGWSLLYDANVRDIEKLGIDRANGRYTKGGAQLRPLPRNQDFIKRAVARLGRTSGDRRENYHLYILEAEKINLPHLVIVAGTSGSGKSTFVDQLQAHELPDDIYRRLPAGVDDWPVVGSSMRPVFPRGAPGIVLQYDMNGRGVSKGRDFSDDPMLSNVENARFVTVVNLRPPPALMIDQLVMREGGGRTKEEILEKAPDWRFLQGSRTANRILGRWKPWIERNRRLSCRRKINLYSQKGWLDAFYVRWDTYLRLLGANGPAVEQIFLEPDLGARIGNAYSWRIASSLQRVGARPAKGAEGRPMSDGVERVS